MAKKVASFRLETELLDWLGVYAKTRDTSQGVLVEEALRHFQGLTAGGVPDLPKPEVPKPVARRQEVEEETSADWAMARQRMLNAAKERASR